ncbi:MAG: YiiX/YebB-like N1pC/P60 family cysteine hydrolase [Flavobacteriales bacterium]
MTTRTRWFLVAIITVPLAASATISRHSGNKPKSVAGLHNGDILFQTLEGGQSDAIAQATGSPWTHVGVVFKEDGEWMVYEAVGPVKATPLPRWIAQGSKGHFVAKRYVSGPNGPLAEEQARRVRSAMERFMGLAYDRRFDWSDERIYCSELVWKAYAEGIGVELCSPRPMRDHSLDSELVRRTMAERYGNAPPLDEPMIAPGALFDCPLLITILER